MDRYVQIGETSWDSDRPLQPVYAKLTPALMMALNWQPIETAPKDGCLYLLCTDGGIMFVGKYRKHSEMWVCQDGAERYRTVTNWMPLPAAPKIP